MEIDILEILDRMDEIRRNHYYDKNPNPDLLCRMLEAVVAKAGGYEGRADWTKALKERPSAYKRDYNDIEKRGKF